MSMSLTPEKITLPRPLLSLMLDGMVASRSLPSLWTFHRGNELYVDCLEKGAVQKGENATFYMCSIIRAVNSTGQIGTWSHFLHIREITMTTDSKGQGQGTGILQGHQEDLLKDLGQGHTVEKAVIDQAAEDIQGKSQEHRIIGQADHTGTGQGHQKIVLKSQEIVQGLQKIGQEDQNRGQGHPVIKTIEQNNQEVPEREDTDLDHIHLMMKTEKTQKINIQSIKRNLATQIK